MTDTINLTRKLRGLFKEDGKDLTWAEMRAIVNEAADRIDQLEEEWSESKHHENLLKALDSGYDKGYRAAMEEIISIAQDIKQEHQDDD
jgi:DNA-binding FadR family transcriptional regulator